MVIKLGSILFGGIFDIELNIWEIYIEERSSLSSLGEEFLNIII